MPLRSATNPLPPDNGKPAGIGPNLRMDIGLRRPDEAFQLGGKTNRRLSSARDVSLAGFAGESGVRRITLSIELPSSNETPKYERSPFLPYQLNPNIPYLLTAIDTVPPRKS